MAWRTTEAAVRKLIDSDPDLDIAPFIDTANALTDKISAADSDSLLNAALLLEIEKYLAAHFYEHLDPQFNTKRTGEASANFQGEFGMALDSSKWGQTAKLLDITGFLAKLGKGKVSFAWLGKPPSDQIAYEDRN